MKQFVQACLAACAKKLLKRHKPVVVGITGSVGKSSTRQAVYAVLKRKFTARASPRNYNTELGVPLTILDLPSAGRSAVGWLRAMGKAWTRATFGMKEYPSTLVLEMGADKAGDIAYLCDIAPPRVGIITAIGESHMEFFGSAAAIEKEKGVLLERLPKDGLAVLNRDDETVWAMRARTKAPVVTYGFHPEAEIRGLEESLSFVCDPVAECGMHVKIAAGGSTVPMFVPGVLGKHAVSAALAAAAVGLRQGMNLVEISDAMREYDAPPGRMRYVAGIKRTVIIDDTYNSAPRSAVAALEVLRSIPAPETSKRIAVLGDMLELGSSSEAGHALVGKKAVECADLLVFVGERMVDAEKAAAAAGGREDAIFHFSTGEEAGRFVQERLKMGDLVLVKGSRGMHLESVVKELMAEPLAAERLLVGYKDEWRW